MSCNLSCPWNLSVVGPRRWTVDALEGTYCGDSVLGEIFYPIVKNGQSHDPLTFLCRPHSVGPHLPCVSRTYGWRRRLVFYGFDPSNRPQWWLISLPPRTPEESLGPAYVWSPGREIRSEVRCPKEWGSSRNGNDVQKKDSDRGE